MSRRYRRTSILAALILSTLACSDASLDGVDAEAPAVNEIDADEASRLRALGYGDVVDAAASDEGSGVVHIDPVPGAAQRGLNYFTNVHGCTSQLIDFDGIVLRSWTHSPCGMWGNSVLLPSGDVLAVHREPRAKSQISSRMRKLLRFDWNGELLWTRQLPVHHDVEVTPRGQIATLTYEHRLVPAIHPTVPVRDHYIELLSQQGVPVERASLFDLLATAPEPFRLKPIEPHFSVPDQRREIDAIHSNSIEWMRRPELTTRDPLYESSNVLISLRTQDAVVIVDWEQKRVVWSWGQDQMSGPHDATVLDNGHLLVFDNGLGRGWSRVIELDPLTREIVWQYRGPEAFFTATRGAAQRLAGGTTLITDSEAGRVFEIAPDGALVWDFLNPNLSDEGKRSIVVRMRRLPEPASREAPFAWSD